MQSQLPPELLDYIFTFMRDDHPSLRHCAAVNQMFSELVERHLYYQITLNNSENYAGRGELTPAQISKLFTDKTRLESHVKSLRIVIASLGILRWFTLRSMNDEDIGQTLHLLSHLTEVSLSGRHNGITSWQRFHHVFHTSFAQTLRLPSLEFVSIHGIEDFPLPLLNNCASLKSLSLRMINYPTLPLPAIANSETELPQLECLEILECTYALPLILIWLQSTGSPEISYLRVLRIMIQRTEDLAHIQAFLLADCSHSLQYLYLDVSDAARTTYNTINERVYPPDSTPHQVLDLSGIPHLKSLTIEAHIKSTSTFWISSDEQEEIEAYNLHTPVPWIAQLLQTLSSDSSAPKHLQRIIFEFSFFIDKHSLTRVDWEPLATVLKSYQLSSLRTVQLRVLRCESTSVDLPALVSVLRGDQYLSELVGNGLLFIDTRYCQTDSSPISDSSSFKL